MVDVYREKEAGPVLAANSRFQFHCHPGLACFNRCCHHPTIILKPYDILRLRRRLGMTAGDFLARYTLTITEDKSLLPLVCLEIDESGAGCPFLGPAGCRVYDDRPAACRLFPVVQGSRLGLEGIEDTYFCKRLEYCQGWGGGREWTLAQWQADQGLEPYDACNREWLEIILERGSLKQPRKDSRAATLFALASYDLDRFRHLACRTPLLQTLGIPAGAAALLEQSDEVLLRFGYKYLKMVLLVAEPGRMKEEMRLLTEPAT